jgi:membrane protein required for colicin V production
MNILDLTYFDYIILVIIAYSLIAAFYKGLIKACTSFFGWIISFMGSYMIYSPIEGVVSKIVTNNLGSVCISLFLGYVISLILTSIITNKILDLTPNIRGGMIDRSLGFAFGLVRGLIISCVIFQIIVLSSPLFLNPIAGSVSPPLPDAVKKAKTYQLLNQGSGLLMSFIPRDMVQKQIDELSSQIAANALSNKKSDNQDEITSKDNKKSDDDTNIINTDSLIKALNSAKSSDTSASNIGNANNDHTNEDGIDITDVIKKLNELSK